MKAARTFVHTKKKHLLSQRLAFSEAFKRICALFIFLYRREASSQLKSTDNEPQILCVATSIPFAFVSQLFFFSDEKQTNCTHKRLQNRRLRCDFLSLLKIANFASHVCGFLKNKKMAQIASLTIYALPKKKVQMRAR